MEEVRSLSILVGFHLLGEAVSAVLPVRIPGNVLGLVLLSSALLTGIVREESLAPAADVLLGNLMLLFTPIVVGTMGFVGLLGKELVPILVALVGSTLAVLLITGKLSDALLGKDGRK